MFIIVGSDYMNYNHEIGYHGNIKNDDAGIYYLT